MEDICKSIVDKISSYDVFNNFFPGIIFCYLVEYITRFSFVTGLELWEKLFVYYFWGMVIGRFGSVVIEKVLTEKIKVRNKTTHQKESFLIFAPYDKYAEAAEKKPFIEKLSEKNNTYRTLTAVCALVILVKLYDSFLYERIHKLGVETDSLILLFVLVLLFVLFVGSYRKQTNYIRKRVEKYFIDKEKEEI